MSTADIGLSPDPKNALNDVSTMNKTMEYMAYELPVVAFDLVETRVSAQDAAVYATPNQVDEYADLGADAARRRGPAQADGCHGPPSGRGRPRLAQPGRLPTSVSTTDSPAAEEDPVHVWDRGDLPLARRSVRSLRR